MAIQISDYIKQEDKGQKTNRNPASGAAGDVIGANGGVEQVHIPNSRVMDYVVRGFDQQLAPFRDPYTKILDLKGNPEAQAINDLRGQFVRTLGDLSPADAEARQVWADSAQRQDAMARGRQLVGANVDPETVQAQNATLRPDDIQAQRAGIARGVSDKLMGPNPQAFVRYMTGGNPGFADKLRAGFADDDAVGRFADAAQTEGGYEQSYKDVMQGSRTTPLAENIDSTNQAAEDPTDLAAHIGNIAADTIQGKSWRHQLGSAVAKGLRSQFGQTKALNDPLVHQMLGDVVFNGADPATVLQNAAKQNVISPSDVVNLMPVLSSASGLQIGYYASQNPAVTGQAGQ